MRDGVKKVRGERGDVELWGWGYLIVRLEESIDPSPRIQNHRREDQNSTALKNNLRIRQPLYVPTQRKTQKEARFQQHNTITGIEQ